MSNQITKENSQKEQPKYSAYYLEEGARLYISLKDKNQNDCYYLITHETNDKYFGITHHETNVYRCSREDTFGKTVFNHGNEQVWAGGVEANEDGGIEKYYTGICMVKSQSEGHLPYGATANDMQSLGESAYLIPKGFGEHLEQKEETLDNQSQTDQILSQE